MNKLQPLTRGQINRFVDKLNKNFCNIINNANEVIAVEIEYQEDMTVPKLVWHTSDGFVGKDSIDKYFSTNEELTQFLNDLF